MPSSEDENPLPRSTLKEFLASISTISGDLSNITAPPFLLATNSTTELPQYWADHPHFFAAPSSSTDPAERALLVLKWFLGSLRNQQYAGRPESEGIKKPLNAFLGEIFLGSFDGAEGETILISEQVSHHPPVTACYLSNKTAGVTAAGFTCQEITFNGSVNVKQKGYAILKISKYNESYLIPVPNVKVKGVLSGAPYPELVGRYSIVSTSGFISEITFEGRGLFSGTKNGIHAKVFSAKQPEEIIYEIEGTWNEKFSIRQGKDTLETIDLLTEPTSKMNLPSVDDQDPWESRRAWRGVIEGLRKGNMQAVSDAKGKVEQGQRQMRKDEAARGGKWEAVFFERVGRDEEFERLQGVWRTDTVVDMAGGIWRVDPKAVQERRKPYHGDLTPANTKVGDSRRASDSTQNSKATTESSTAAAAPAPTHTPATAATTNGASVNPQADNNPTATPQPNGSTIPSRPKSTSSSSSSSPPKEEYDGDTISLVRSTYKEKIDQTQLERTQIEEFLRNKYSNAPQR